MSANVLLGRSHIGVHWRMDGVYGALMGETNAVRRLQQVRWLLFDCYDSYEIVDRV